MWKREARRLPEDLVSELLQSLEPKENVYLLQCLSVNQQKNEKKEVTCIVDRSRRQRRVSPIPR